MNIGNNNNIDYKKKYSICKSRKRINNYFDSKKKSNTYKIIACNLYIFFYCYLEQNV